MKIDRVVVYEETVSIREHNQLPLNPHPPYGNITGYLCYPNLFYGSKQFQITERQLKLLVAENKYLKIAMAPDYGGRLWYVYDKLKNREVIHRVNTEAKAYNAGMGLNYMGGGLELNLPNAHSQTNMRKRACYARKNTDGSASLIMQNIEKIGRIHWSVTFTLHPDEARIEQKVRIANETPFEARYLYWANCGVPADGDTEFVYPEKSGSLHGDYINSISWPKYGGTNIALLKNLDEALGLYMLDAREGYFGSYDHNAQCGLLHYADINDLPGKKTWTWGWHGGTHTANTHSDTGRCYIEIQSGRIVIQEELERIMPMSSAEWTEYWYPYSDIGIANGASADAAMNFSIEAINNDKSVAKIKLFANRNLKDLKLVVLHKDEVLNSVPLASLQAGSPREISEELNCNPAETEAVSAVLFDSNDAIVVRVLPLAAREQTLDSYFTPPVLPENKAEDFTAEGVFSKAEILLKDWFYHLPEIKRLLNKSLSVDPGFSRSHTELGIINLRGGQFEAALKHFDKTLERIVDDGRTIYYRGLTLWLLGRTDEARTALRRSGRFGYESQERIMEAIIAINGRDDKDAYEQLEKAELVGDSILLIKVLKAILLNRNGQSKEAVSALKAAEKITCDNSFVYCLRYLLAENDAELKQQIKDVYSGLQSEIIEVIAVLYFAGLYREAYSLFELIDASNSIVDLYRKRLEKLLGIQVGAVIPPTGEEADFAWRLEEFMLLREELKLNPENAENYFHLGNFYYGHSCDKEGIKFWEQAKAQGFHSPILLYQLARAYKSLGDKGKTNKYIREAYAVNGDDPYIFDDYAEMIFTEKGIESGIEFLEANLSTTRKYFTSMHKLLSSYIETGNYDKLEEMLGEINFGAFWRRSFGTYWVIMKQAKAYMELLKENYADALEYFIASTEVPSNISHHHKATLAQLARKEFYSGLCYAKLGNNAAAEQHWQSVLDIKTSARFEPSAQFSMACTRFFHVFALKGLKRHTEAETCIQLIKASALNQKLPANAKKSLLKLGDMAEKYNFENFEKFDTAVGIASRLSIATSVED